MKYKLFLIIAVLVFTAAGTFAQYKPCLLDIKDAPTLGGIRLGMKKSQIEAALGTRLDDQSGHVYFNIKIKRDFPFDAADPVARKVIEYYKQLKGAPRTIDEFLPIPSSTRVVSFQPNAKQRNTENLKNIWLMNLSFFNDRLYGAAFYYFTEDYQGLTSEALAVRMTELLDLPPESVVVNGHVECPNFSVTFTKLGNASYVKGVLKPGTEMLISMSDSVIGKALMEKARQDVRDTYEKFKNEK
jgi:hypothetical protein